MKRTSFLVLASILALTAGFAQSEQAEREAPPAGGEPKDFKLAQQRTFELENGLGATLVQYGAVPMVDVSVVVRAGNIDERADQVWLADLTGDLLSEGAGERDAATLAADLAGMGGDLGINVGFDQITIGSDALSEFTAETVRLLADVVRNPALPETELDRLKKDMARTLTIQLSQPQPVANQRFSQILYPNHPYGRLYPTEEMVQGYSIEDVRGFHEAGFGARRTHVYVVGKFDESAVENAIRESFSDWEKGRDPARDLPKMRSERAVHLIDRPGAPQSTLRIGLPSLDPSNGDYMALVVTNALLGGSFGSRITSNIREDKGYTYSPFSNVSVHYRSAHWVQNADVTTEVTGASLKEIFYEIDRLRDEPPSADELRGIQNYLAGIFVLQNSSRGGIIGQLANLNLHGLDDAFLTNYVQNIYAVTPERVQEIARRYLPPDKMTIVVVGDRAKVKSQVEAYGKIVDGS